MSDDPIRGPKTPAAIGPYSTAMVAPAHASIVFCSGQLPVDPETGQVIEGDIGAQTTRCLLNLAAVLYENQCLPGNVMKTTVFLSDMNDFGAMNAAYAAFFGGHKPARACVEVRRLPKDVAIEIEAIAAHTLGPLA